MSLFPSARVYTVSELTVEVKAHLEAEFSSILVEGEISNFTAAASGHLYFILKDICICYYANSILSLNLLTDLWHAFS